MKIYIFKKKIRGTGQIKRKKPFTIVFMTILIFITLIPFQNAFFSNGDLTSNEKAKEPKSAGYWVLPSPILIDNNWSSYEGLSWLRGNGTSGNPYIIENVTIDGGGSQSCIEIRNSKAYFILRNCTLLHSSMGYTPVYDAGIMLYNTSNGQLIDNNCSNNLGNGIVLDYHCDNNTILGNTVNDNNRLGIHLYRNCENNTISGNTISNNDYYGINLASYCDDNTISGNTVDYSPYGINLYQYCDNNSISGNTISENTWGIYLNTRCVNNNISGNPVSYNDYGIYLTQQSNGNTILGNTLNNNIEYAIELMTSCDNNNITTNTVSNNGNGIYLRTNCDDNTISGNTLTDNGDYCEITVYDCNRAILFDNTIIGIGLYVSGSIDALRSHDIKDSNEVNGKPIYYYVDEMGLNTDDFNNAGQVFLINCNYSTISGLDISNVYHAIYLCSSSHNTISGNTVNDNDVGIYLKDNCQDNIISENEANENSRGFYLDNNCDDNTISGNTAKFNSYGIYLYQYCDFNIISGNTASNNSRGIYLYQYCENNTISGNSANDNYYGLYFELSCNNNTISRNMLTDGNEQGITLWFLCDNNTISGNHIINSNAVGIRLTYDCNYNLIYENILINNTINAEDNCSNNQWDDGSHGNYWSDYEGIDEEDPLNIGDSLYNVSGTAGAQDRYPLMSALLSVFFTANTTRIVQLQWIQFTYAGYGGMGQLNYYWDFGDGETSTERNPKHQYTSVGSYTVTLRVIDEDDYEDIEIKVDYIVVDPTTTTPGEGITGGGISIPGYDLFLLFCMLSLISVVMVYITNKQHAILRDKI